MCNPPALIEFIDVDEADGSAIRMLRYSNVSPRDVIADLYILNERSWDITYEGAFAAALIAYAAIAKFIRYVEGDNDAKNDWERDYVLVTKPKYDTVSYVYTFYITHFINKKTTLTIKKRTAKGLEVIFEGTLQEAYEKFCKDSHKDGAHVNRQIFDIVDSLERWNELF